ncbi:MAG: shikimate dehydrogenase [Candidatus Omnitrophota bacterium]
MEKAFAFIVHPLDIGLVSVAFNEPTLINKKLSLVKKAFEWLPSFKCSEITGICSIKGTKIKGHLMYCALLPEQIISLDESFVLDRVVSAGEIARDLGASLIGVGAYVAQIGKKGVVLARKLQMPVTTGTHYTIWITIKSVLEAAEKIGKDVTKCNVAIIGATGKVGKICGQFFSEKASQVTLAARNRSKLEYIREGLLTNINCKAQVLIEDDIKTAVKNADISIMSTSVPFPLIDVDELTARTIVCDISRPRNVSKKRVEMRRDVLVIDGGIVQPPGDNMDFNFYFGLPKGLAYACMAETMILTLEEKYENYSIGGNMIFDKVKEIGALGEKHGFKLAKIRSFGIEIEEEVYENIRKRASQTIL